MKLLENNSQSNSRFNILMVSAGFYPKVGGTERQAETLARALVRDGYGVRILTLQFRDGLPLTEDLDGLAVSRIAYPRIKLFGMAVVMVKLAWRLFRDRKLYTIIHVHMVEYLAFLAGLLGPMLKKPVIMKFAVLRPPKTGLRFTNFPASVYRWRFIERLLMIGIHRADRFVAISSMIEEMAKEHGISGDRIVRIPNGVRTDRYCALSPSKRDHLRQGLRIRSRHAVVFAGRLVAQKGVSDLLAAWQQIRARNLGATLYILGTGRLEDHLKMEMESLGLSGSVEFRGVVENVADYLQSADLFVLPSRFEGMPNSLLEAMACGLPVIATAVSGTVEIIRDGQNGLLVEPAKPRALAEAIDRVLAAPGMAMELGAAARKTAESSYSIEAVAKAYSALYDQVVAKRTLN